MVNSTMSAKALALKQEINFSLVITAIYHANFFKL